MKTLKITAKNLPTTRKSKYNEIINTASTSVRLEAITTRSCQRTNDFGPLTGVFFHTNKKRGAMERYDRRMLDALKEECGRVNRNCGRCRLKRNCDMLDKHQQKTFDGRCPVPRVWSERDMLLLAGPTSNDEERYEQWKMTDWTVFVSTSQLYSNSLCYILYISITFDSLIGSHS